MSSLFFLFFFIQTLVSISQAVVPKSEQFKYVNQGEFGDYIVEYDADYRLVSQFAYPFELGFYNTTPNAYYLALRVGTKRSTSVMRWVWEFNRGNPVRDNATFSLGRDGNLVLAEADGRVVWQSGTKNKGVVGFELLSTGNMVLRDAKGKFIWQSFDYPTDTLVVQQSLRSGSRLVSRASPEKNANGPYSLVLEPSRLAMYYKSRNSPKPQLYFVITFGKESSEYVKLNTELDGSNANEITLDLKMVSETFTTKILLGTTRYNSTVTYLRLGIDGTLKAFTYDQEAFISAWEVTFDLFATVENAPRVATIESNPCQLPEKCGKFGLCDKGQCVACPSPTGLLGWSEKCKPSKVSSCAVKGVKYYKLVGVDHFTSTYEKGEGPMKENECGKKCTSDCKCLGYFYQQDKSMCWIAYDLMTLTKVANKKHLGYIKY